MQSSNEPNGEANDQDLERAQEGIEPVSQPFYEFPAGNPLTGATPPSARTPHVDSAEQPASEAIQQGLVYPPPPSYYQNMPISSERPPLPARPAEKAERVPVNYKHSPEGQHSSRTVQVPPYPRVPVYGAPQPGQNRAKWVWIFITIVGTAFLISCSLCSWAFYNVLNLTNQQASGATNVVEDYYRNIERKDYAAAYSDLAPTGQIKGLSERDFILKAQQRDASSGAVLSYTAQQPSFTSDAGSGLDLSYITVQVNITREKLNYTASLTVHKNNGSWKITDFNDI